MSALAYRAADAGDHALILDSWLRSYRSARSAGLISAEDWREVQGRQIEKLMAIHETRTWVAHHPGNVDRVADLYGWICVGSTPLENLIRHRIDYVGSLLGEGARRATRQAVTDRANDVLPPSIPIVHYVYVIGDYRRKHLCRGLFSAVGIDPSKPFIYSCRTAVVSSLPRNAGRFDPDIARFAMSAPPKEKPHATKKRSTQARADRSISD